VKQPDFGPCCIYKYPESFCRHHEEEHQQTQVMMTEIPEGNEKGWLRPNQHLHQAVPSTAGHRFTAEVPRHPTLPRLHPGSYTPKPLGCQHRGVWLQATNGVDLKPPSRFSGSVTQEKGRCVLPESFSYEQPQRQRAVQMLKVFFYHAVKMYV